MILVVFFVREFFFFRIRGEFLVGIVRNFVILDRYRDVYLFFWEVVEIF